MIADLSKMEEITPATLFAHGYTYTASTDKWNIGDQACDYIFCSHQKIDFEIPGTLGVIIPVNNWDEKKIRHFPLFTAAEFLSAGKKSSQLNFVRFNLKEILSKENNSTLEDPTVVVVLQTANEHGMAEQRRAFIELMSNHITRPVVLQRQYSTAEIEVLTLHASTDLAALLLDGMGDGVWITADTVSSRKSINSTSFGILQATRTRISKTEYISCPSCGRTLFDLQETTAKIRNRTDHLKGIKIGIMGCIVNGPGEMADADYGYVGTGVGKITLYKGKEVVQRNIDSENAVDELIQLIRLNGDWIEPVA